MKSTNKILLCNSVTKPNQTKPTIIIRVPMLNVFLMVSTMVNRWWYECRNLNGNIICNAVYWIKLVDLIWFFRVWNFQFFKYEICVCVGVVYNILFVYRKRVCIRRLYDIDELFDLYAYTLSPQCVTKSFFLHPQFVYPNHINITA